MSQWTPTAIAKEPERERAHSSCRTAVIMTSAPAPPYRSSYSRPRKPSSPMRRKIAFGMRPAVSHASTCGITSFSTKDRTVARNMSCCSSKTFTRYTRFRLTASRSGKTVVISPSPTKQRRSSSAGFAGAILFWGRHRRGPSRRRRACEAPPPNLIRCCRLDLAVRLLVGLHGLLEIAVLFTAKQADPIEPREVLLGLGQIAEGQVGLTDVFVRARVARIQRQRLLVQRDRLGRIAALARGIRELVPRVGVVRRALHDDVQQGDRARE